MAQKKPNSFQRGVQNLQTFAKIAPIARRAYQGIGELFDDADPALTYAPNVSLSDNGLGNVDYADAPQGIPSLEEQITNGPTPPEYQVGGLDPGLSFGDISSGLSGLDFGVDPFAGISFGDTTDIAGFGNQFDFSPDVQGLDFGSAPGMDIFKEVGPWLNAASYIADPSKIGSALKLGEGNFFGDVSQLAGLGSAIGGIGGALGAGLGGLTSLAPMLGPIGIFAGALGAMIGGPSKDERQMLNSYNYLTKPTNLFEQVDFLAGGNAGQYDKYFSSESRSLSDRIKADRANGNNNFYNTYLNENSSTADRLAAYGIDYNTRSVLNDQKFNSLEDVYNAYGLSENDFPTDSPGYDFINPNYLVKDNEYVSPFGNLGSYL